MHNIGPSLTAWRLSRGLNQDTAAKLAGLPRPNLSAIERGHRDITLSTLEKLAIAYNTTPGALLDQAPPSPITLSNRHEIDALARAVASGERPFAEAKNQLADEIASLLSNRLKAHGAPGYQRIKRRKWDNGAHRLVIYRLYGQELVERLLKRVEIHL